MGLVSLSKLVLVLLFFMNTRSVENSAFEIIAEIFRGVRDWSKSIGGGGGWAGAERGWVMRF